MHTHQQSGERRRHQRYRIQADAFAMVSPLSAKRLEIIDISKGGLAMRYVPGDERARICTDVDVFLNIFLRDLSFCLLRVPARPISDIHTKETETDQVIHRRSVEFGPLSDNQALELDAFINQHAVI